MIRLTRLNRVPLVLNSDLIEQIEVTPDTVITLTTGQKMIVLESANEVVRRIVAFRRAIQNANFNIENPFDFGEMEERGTDAG